MNKKRKKLDLNILSTVLKPFFENCKQYTVRFFQITHPQKYFGNVLFGSSFSTHNVCTFDIKCNSWLKRILDLIAKKKNNDRYTSYDINILHVTCYAARWYTYFADNIRKERQWYKNLQVQ